MQNNVTEYLPHKESEILPCTLLRPIEEIKILWHGLDLRWAYADLLPTIYRHTNGMQLAYDVLHDAMLRFALTRNPQRVEQPHAYLRTIVRNVLSDHFNEAARFSPLILDIDLARTDESGIAGTRLHQLEENYSPSPEHLADLQQRLMALQSIIEHLPPRCREVFWLFRIDGMSQADIALQLGISLNMVERHMIRALVDLRTARSLLM